MICTFSFIRVKRNSTLTESGLNEVYCNCKYCRQKVVIIIIAIYPSDWQAMLGR